MERTRVLSETFRRLRAEMLEACDEVLRDRRGGTESSEHGGIVDLALMPVTMSEPVGGSTACDFVDIEMLEDRELLSAINGYGFNCDKCGSDEPLVAVARLEEAQIAMGLCGDCYRELKAMSRGEVV